MEKQKDFKEFIGVFKAKLGLLITLPLICIITTFLVLTYLINPTYQSSVDIIVTNSSPDSTNASDYNDLLMFQNLVKTYAELAKSNSVLEPVIDEIGQDQLKNNDIKSSLTVTPKNGTQLLNISVNADDPYTANMIANGVARSLKKVGIIKIGSDNIQLLDTATLQLNPVSPNVIFNCFVVFIISFVLVIIFIVINSTLDTTIKRRKEIERLTGYPVIGMIPLERGK